MRARMALVVGLMGLLTGCSELRHYRPGPEHAGLRSYIYEHSPIDDHPMVGKFQERPIRGTRARPKSVGLLP